MKTIISLLVVISVVELIAFGSPKLAPNAIATHVKGEKWIDIGNLQDVAYRRLAKDFPNHNFLKDELTTWIDPTSTNSFVLLSYFSSLGKQAYLVRFDRSGEITDVHSGQAVDSEIDLKR